MVTANTLRQSNGVIREAVRYGPVATFLVMCVISFGVAYIIHLNLISGWSAGIAEFQRQVAMKEAENQRTETLLADEERFRVRMATIVGLYNDAKPLLPQETEVSDVLGQVEAAARKNGVTVTGLTAVKESVKSPTAEKLYEREIPALVTGSYPQVVSFLSDVSRMPRILVVRDYSIVSLKNSVTAGFTLMAYHSPPPAEIPKMPGGASGNQTDAGGGK